MRAGALSYAPVGGGSYHWVARDERREQRFVTVDDLDDKGWLGRTRPAVFAGLRAAMDAAVTLRDQAALGFVVAPVPALDGQTVRPLGDRHAVAVFPFLPGTPGRWGEALAPPARAELVAMLAALHRADPVAVRLPRPGVRVVLARRPGDGPARAGPALDGRPVRRAGQVPPGRGRGAGAPPAGCPGPLGQRTTAGRP